MYRQQNKALIILGERIRQIRKAKGFSQENFAVESDLNRSFYGCIERGEKNPSALVLMRIALALGIEVGELFPAREDFQMFF
jgi:transcriptional regulator with XRE-family HTH domain